LLDQYGARDKNVGRIVKCRRVGANRGKNRRLIKEKETKVRALLFGKESTLGVGLAKKKGGKRRHRTGAQFNGGNRRPLSKFLSKDFDRISHKNKNPRYA